MDAAYSRAQEIVASSFNSILIFRGNRNILSTGRVISMDMCQTKTKPGQSVRAFIDRTL